MRTNNRIALAAALGAVFATGGVFAETASDSVDATAGLQPVLELTCTDVSFGVWRVPVRSDGGITTITLDAAANTVTPSGNTTQVAQSANASWTHSRGTCTVSGSAALDDATPGISYVGNTSMLMGGHGAVDTGFTNLDAPASAASLTANITGPASCTIAGGECTFHLGGTLTIPETILADNYGGYKTSEPATITVDDGA